MIRYLPYFLASFTISALMVPAFRGLSLRAGELDRGTSRTVPRLGGAGIFCAFLLSAIYSLTAIPYAGKLPVILLASLIVFAAGVYDDIKGSSIWAKLLAEGLAALLAYSAGVRVIMPWSRHGVFSSGWLSLPVTVLWILIVTNSMNLIDGLDGFSAGTGILASTTLLVFGGLAAYGNIACTLLAGSLAGFLVYNLPAASVFMGDSGSLFTGFILACLSVSSFARASTPGAGMVPVVVFSLPLTDMLYAVLRRYYRGLPLGLADREHIHHKLLKKGLSGGKALLVLYAINVAIVSLGLLLVRISSPLIVFALLIAAALLGLQGFGYIKLVPFAKGMIKNIGQGRKIRYCNFAIRRFRRDASRAHSLDSFGSGIEKLAVSVQLLEVEIVLHAPTGKIPFFLYAGGQTPGRPFTLSLPMSCGQINSLCPGQIRITACAGGDFTPDCASIVHAISEETGRFLAKKSFSPAFSLDAGGAAKVFLSI